MAGLAGLPHRPSSETILSLPQPIQIETIELEISIIHICLLFTFVALF